MPALRTTLLAAGLGAAALATTALVATNATAAPVPVAAVEQLTAVEADVPTSDATTPDATTDGGTASDGTARTRARTWWTGLTDAQRSCLQDQDITRPVGRLDDAERAALRASVEAAAKTCDVTLPFPRARAFWDGLTAEQQACIKDAGVNRPWGPLTTEQRQAVRKDLKAAAEKCGVTLPAVPATR